MSKSDQKKGAALAALMDSGSLSEAAEKAGVDRRTLYNYLHHDIDFAQAYDEIRNRQAIANMDDLMDRRRRAYDIIMGIMEDEDQPATVRLKAAQTILTEAAGQERIVSDIAQRDISANTGWDLIS